ncbi:molybdopterin binding aldehyde oxidase/xanthine dehydrogenase [Pseudomassariella vexata]|uniref:Molybdopterin binding aldehyde oxidase/xanthine dehydrogenase n=1 Tax=Pseudomassariella vexata TaxID=1141098 RepID=A0A1Y2DK80_9PEZI|nr:molybdopterin binding aldehyde oxidase/xanthine dehydrogenase [Pseudomassariella vexata]ORY59677.1 molybdopterin binding aldehyde oxidase/xanthine dehydrogenase [Pseudomassariella vexata]
MASADVLPKPPVAAARLGDAAPLTVAEALSPLIQSTYKTSELRFYVNGRKISVTNPNPDWVLLDWIRAQDNLKGTKLGCGEGGCGACTVVLQMVEHGRLRHMAVNACLFPLVGVDGKALITIEGLGTTERPHPLQERIAKLHGSQCGFCTPGIVMSLYALIRNSYQDGKFRLTSSDVELQGHLDGNLCRCTGYKPILEAAKTFIIEDLRGIIEEDSSSEIGESISLLQDNITEVPMNSGCGIQKGSCGRPGGCCRDASSSVKSSCDKDSSSQGSTETRATSVNSLDKPQGVGDFLPYDPTAELIFPPSLWKFRKEPIMYGDERKIWFKPITLQQLVALKSAWPAAKIVGGASETQIEVRFKKFEFRVSVYASDIEELSTYTLPKTDTEIKALTELTIPGNLSLTKVEELCMALYQKLGRRAMALEALRKQLRYFAGRQIRNVASLAGNLATASPISDSAPVLLASGARVTVMTQKQGSWDVPLSSFFVRYRKTTLPEDGTITKIIIPLADEDSQEITKAYKQAKRKDDDIAIVTTGFQVRLDKDGLVKRVILAFGGMAPTTVLATKTQDVILGKRFVDGTTLESALDALMEDFDLPFGAPGGMAHYRKALTLSMFFRFWHEVVTDLGLAKVDPEIIREIHREISTGSRGHFERSGTKVVGKEIPHLSALKHCTGEAEYVDDIPRQHNELFGALVLSKMAHAKILRVNWAEAMGMPGVVGYLDRNSVPEGSNNWGPIRVDEPLFAGEEVHSHGQTIGMVYAETALQAQAAAAKVHVSYEVLPAILTIEEAIKAKSFFEHGRQLKKGAAVNGLLDDVFADCAHVFEGTTKLGGQEHFYLETNAALAIPHVEDGSMEVYSSSQNLMENQVFVAQVLGVPMSRVNMRVRRLGGAYGGKESRSTPIACLVAIAAKKERRPIRIMLNRDEDIATSGQRHPMQCRWKVGTDDQGRLKCLDADLYNNGGYSLDMSSAVMDRACTHVDNCYNIPNAWIRGWVCKTNTVTNTAFRGFGGPQGMYFTESIMSTIAEDLNIDIDELRLRNLYNVGDRTPFLQEITDDFHIKTMMEQLSNNSEYELRKAAVNAFNAKSQYKKRGICKVPSKFGLSFATALHLNQAGAYVKIYEDGSVLLHHGGTEMGQGLYTKMCQVAAEELGVDVDDIYNKESQTDQVANPSPTAASSGSDLNGMAIKNACDQLNERLKPYREKYGADTPLSVIAHAAYRDRVNLAANGFWKMPRVGFQWGNYKDPLPMYYYWTQGVGITEVELDLLTGDHTVLRTDIMMDVGRSINPAIDYGQIEGAFVQGQGLFTMEESLWTRTGQLFTLGPGTYKIPGFSDIPQIFNVSMLKHDSEGKPISWKNLRSIQSSKGIGEPPLFLGSTVFFALREAVRAARGMNCVAEPLVLNAPATPEKLRLAVGDDLLRRAAVIPKDGETNFFVRIEE